MLGGVNSLDCFLELCGMKILDCLLLGVNDLDSLFLEVLELGRVNGLERIQVGVNSLDCFLELYGINVLGCLLLGVNDLDSCFLEVLELG